MVLLRRIRVGIGRFIVFFSLQRLNCACLTVFFVPKMTVKIVRIPTVLILNATMEGRDALE